MNIIWTPEAEITFNANLDYVLLEWGEKVALNFINRVDDVILKIKRNPSIFPAIHTEQRIHRCIVVRSVSLYYRIVSDERIDLISFWNNYQDPERLLFK